ncbi:MAG: DUF4430 domain-containing protein [Candidatus Nomurabacteria bacterium]|nr:DUF4430 domain-containing protein [Candidatus Nomurabacteria bacterium]
MKNPNKKYIIILAIIFIVIFSIFIFSSHKTVEAPEIKNITLNTLSGTLKQNSSQGPSLRGAPLLNKERVPKAGEVLVPLNTNVITLKIADTNINLPIQNNSSLYDILLAGQNAGQINFTGKNYSGMGFFISSIGNLKEGNGKYLIYYINGIEANLGISSYVPKVGDVVEWKLSESL